MKVGIIGSGIVGRVLATGFLNEGHQVMLGTRNISKEEVVKWKNENKNGLLGSFQETAQFGEVIVLAVSGLVTEDAINLAGREHLSNKVIIDTTNPIADAPPVNGVLTFFTSLTDSLLERLQKLAPDVHFVKAFSCIGSSFMVNPDFDGVRPTMFICGNEDAAKKQVGAIVEQFGFETADMGKAEAARAIEPLCILWCLPGFLHNTWTHAFKLLKK